MLRVTGLEDQARWTATVKGFSRHDIYYLPQYVKAFRLHGDGEPLLCYFESGNTRAINVVMKRDISSCAHFKDAIEPGTLFDLSTPYGYGGFLIEGDAGEGPLKKLDGEYCEWCRENGVVSEFVRFHPVLENHLEAEHIYDTVRLGKTVSIDLASPETIYKNISKSKRTRINKALREGMEVCWGWDASLLDVFREMYVETMDRNAAQEYYYFEKSFFDSILVDLKDNARLFYARKDGRIIGTELILYCNSQMHSHLAATKTEALPLSPVTVISYKAALWGCENGIKTYHLGGGVGGQKDSLYTHKHEMNLRSENVFAIGKKIFDKAAYNRLLDIRKRNGGALDPGFFPQYRA